MSENEIDKIYLLHDFTEFVIEKSKNVDEQAIYDFIESLDCEDFPCYMDGAIQERKHEIEDYLLQVFVKLAITKKRLFEKF